MEKVTSCRKLNLLAHSLALKLSYHCTLTVPTKFTALLFPVWAYEIPTQVFYNSFEKLSSFLFVLANEDANYIFQFITSNFPFKFHCTD